jgi:hypothetical protein
MRKICTTGHIELKNFFNEIGIGSINRMNQHLVAPGNAGWLNGDTSDTYYYVDSEGRFECGEAFPSGYGLVPIPEFIEYHRARLNPKQSKMITVTKKELGKIYEVACTPWKARIQDLTLRNPFGTDVELSQAEIDEMFKAATKDQIPTLESIFGKQEKIDFDRIKTGSKVILQYTGEHCCGFDAIDRTQPVDVVFFKTPHLIDSTPKFKTKGSHQLYCTFHQNGKYALFSAEEDNLGYITKVVEY